MDRKIMMRKYGLDEGTAYVETQTLLEPNNVIPSWEAGDEEKKEVSKALRDLRKKYDHMHRMVKDKSNELNLLDKEMKRAQGEEKAVSRDFGSGNKEFEEAELRLELFCEAHDFQRMNTRTYRYMLDRMSKDLIALTLEINDLTESLRSKKQIMEDEANKKILARENKLQSNYRY
jgi:hypothetical protein